MIAEYSLFLAKVFTVVVAIIFVAIALTAIAAKGKDRSKEKLSIKKINDKYKELAKTIHSKILPKHELKQWLKKEKKTSKEKNEPRKRLFVINFHGDIRASAVKSLREEITAILTSATTDDEVVLRLESPGGLVHTYGLAASQLQRLKQRQIPLTVAIDKMAASGGYLMACIAQKIIAAPFAIVGSIGVIAQIPNFNRLLKKHDIDFEQFMAGDYKRTVTLFGENTEKGRSKFQEELQEVHVLFKNFIHEHRPQVNLEQVATGEHWFGTRALELKLVDQIMTSDDYLLNAAQTADIYEITIESKKGMLQKLSMHAHNYFDNLLNIIWQRENKIS